MATTKFYVVRYFNGERRSTASSHGSLPVARREAAKLNRSFKNTGWGAFLHDANDHRIVE